MKGHQYTHFWKAHITNYSCAKFQVSVINSVWEKCNVNVFGPFPNDYVPLWPLREDIELSIFGKPSSHTTSLASFKFLCSIVSGKSATLTFWGVFPKIIAPYDPWPLQEVIKLCIFGKPSPHTTIRPSFKILWLTVSEKSPTLKFWCTPTPTPTPDESQRNASVHRLTLLRKFVKKHNF